MFRNWFLLVLVVICTVGLASSATEPIWTVYQLTTGQLYVTQSEPEAVEHKALGKMVRFKDMLVITTVTVNDPPIGGKIPPARPVTGLFSPAAIGMKPLTSIAIAHIIGTREMTQAEYDQLRSPAVALERKAK